LNIHWKRRHLLTQGWRRRRQVLTHNLPRSSIEGTLTTQPLINNNAQSILITGRTRLALKLLRGHVGERTSFFPRLERTRIMGDRDNAKITVPEFVGGA